MNGNFDSQLSFVPGTNALVMGGPLVSETPADLSLVVSIEVELLDGGGTVVEHCHSNGTRFSPAPAPGAHWVMVKSTNRVASGQTVTGRAKAFDRNGTEVADWQAQVAIV